MTPIIDQRGAQVWPRPSADDEGRPSIPDHRHGGSIAVLCPDGAGDQWLHAKIMRLLSESPYRDRIVRCLDKAGVGVVIILRSQQAPDHLTGLPTVIIDDRSLLAQRAAATPCAKDAPHRYPFEATNLEHGLIPLVGQLLAL